MLKEGKAGLDVRTVADGVTQMSFATRCCAASCPRGRSRPA